MYGFTTPMHTVHLLEFGIKPYKYFCFYLGEMFTSPRDVKSLSKCVCLFTFRNKKTEGKNLKTQGSARRMWRGHSTGK